MMPAKNEHCEVLKNIAFGRVLELGYGFGVSSSAMVESDRVLSITSWEPEEQYWPVEKHEKINIVGGSYWITDGDYDFVFIDHWPLYGETRKEAARHWRSKGAVVVVDDAGLEPDLAEEAYKILDMWVMK